MLNKFLCCHQFDVMGCPMLTLKHYTIFIGNSITAARSSPPPTSSSKLTPKFITATIIMSSSNLHAPS